MSEQKLEEDEGMSPADIWKKNITGIGEKLCKGLGAGTCLICLKNSKEVNGVKAVRWRGAGNEVREATGLGRDHVGPGKPS